MDSTRPIRALLRGLDALAALNACDGATVSELVGTIRLPRTTVYRVLETLCEAGYVDRDAGDDRYRLTRMVRGLADSWDTDAALVAAAEPAIAGLARSLRAVAGIATLSGLQMRLHETAVAGTGWTDAWQPLATGAAGRVYLAHCSPGERERLAAALYPPRRTAGEAAARDSLFAALPAVAAQGYASDATLLCVPLRAADGRLAVLTARAPAQSLVALQACAGELEGLFKGQSSGTHRAAVPATAH
jgi:IclR family mhp operon transcriptional activator